MEVKSEIVSKWCSQLLVEKTFHTKHVKPHKSLCTIKEACDQTKIVSIVKSPCNITTLSKSTPIDLIV
jgi:hypothetical protein